MRRGPDRGLPKVLPRVGMWPRRERPRRPLLPQVVQLLVTIGFLVGCYHGVMWYWERTAPKEVKIPKLVGLTEREAAAVLESIGLQAVVVGRKADEEIPEGGVLEAQPPAERSVKLGRVVRLTLSSGSRWSVVPDVREMSVDRARALLRKAGLSVGRERAIYDSKVPIGYVVGQVPESGEQVPREMAIDLSVSKGPAPRPLEGGPGVSGGVARSTEIEFVVPPGAGLQEVRIVVQDDQGERTVYRQAHEPGEKISKKVSGSGRGISVKVYLSGEVMQERTF